MLKLLKLSNPLRRMLEHHHRCDLVNNGWNHLHSACTVSNDRHSFTGEINIGWPVRGMKIRSAKGFGALDSGNLWFVVRTHGADDHIGAQRIGTARTFDGQSPALGSLVIDRGDNTGIKSNV